MEAWIVIGVIATIGFIVWLIGSSKSKTPPQAQSEMSSDEAESVTFTYRVTKSERQTEQPRGPLVQPRWIPRGESIEVANAVIKGGMLYFGSDLRAISGEIEPALIEPRLTVSRTAAHYSQRQTDYWPSYSTISSDARRTYLLWLASGRDDPSADVGYVFLYYYGLERRALVDAATDPRAKAELPEIEKEVGRLLGIYSANRSFRGYATGFLEYLRFQRAGNLLSSAPPELTDNADLPAALKIGLGRFAVSGQPVPASWAFAWMQCDPRIGTPKSFQRCPSEFKKLFAKRYGETYGEGMKLSVNRTKLHLAYRPASSGFAGKEAEFFTEPLPDVTAVVAPIKKLETIAEECSTALAPYSRFVGKNPEEAKSLDGILLLPRPLWPESARNAIGALDKRIGDGLRVTTLGELSDSLGGAGSLTRNKVRALAHALGEIRIGVEPDVLAGARTPKAEDKIILFRSDTEDAALRESNAYQAASVSLDLACSVAMADGQPHPNELQLLMKQIDGWAQLSIAQRKRLRARLRMAIDSPPSLASLRSKLEIIPTNGKRAIAHLMSTLAQADGEVEPSEVKLLERIYRALGLEAQLVYSDLHITSTQAIAPAGKSGAGSPASSGIAPEKPATIGGDLKLDPARIAALQKETAEVSALLSSVFTNDAPVSEEQKEERNEASSVIEPGPLGLDPEHSVFLRLIMTRASWSRQELADAAADMELMLDGAIERINDASFEHFEAPLLEGDDPIEVSRDIQEKVVA